MLMIVIIFFFIIVRKYPLLPYKAISKIPFKKSKTRIGSQIH